MRLFNFLKNSTIKQKQSSVAQVDFDHLTSEGDLPFGWIYRNKEFTDQINNEFSCFNFISGNGIQWFEYQYFGSCNR